MPYFKYKASVRSRAKIRHSSKLWGAPNEHALSVFYLLPGKEVSKLFPLPLLLDTPQNDSSQYGIEPLIL